MHTTTLRLHETGTGRSHRSGELVGFTAHGKLCFGVRGGLHVGEFERALFRKVVETTGNHDFGLAGKDGVASNLDGLKGGSARSDGDLDGTTGRKQKKVDPTGDSVDETATLCISTLLLLKKKKTCNSRFLQDILLNISLLSPILEHRAHRVHTTHTGTQRSTNFARVDVLVQFVRVGDTGHDQSLHSADQSPKGSPVSLGDNILGQTESTSVPTGRKLASDDSVKLDSLGEEDPGTLVELDEPLAGFLGPDVDLVAVLALESSGLFSGDFKRLEIVIELNLLNETLLLRVVTPEQVGF